MGYLQLSLKTLSKVSTWFVLLYDLFAVIVCWSVSYLIWANFHFIRINYSHQLNIVPIVILAQLITLLYFKQHRKIWRFTAFDDVLKMIQVVAVSCFLTITALFFMRAISMIPRTVLVLYPVLLLGYMAFGRILYRVMAEKAFLKQKSTNRILILGAGKSADMFLRDCHYNRALGYKPVCLLDDKESRVGKEIRGVRVAGFISDLVKVCKTHNPDIILIAIPSLSGPRMREILSLCEKTHLPVRIVPSLADITSGKVSISDIRDVDIEDLLGRAAISLDTQNVKAMIENKVVMITGGGGSIGSELCRQVSSFNPKKLIIIDNAEYNLYSTTKELDSGHIPISHSLIDISDFDALKALFAKEGKVDTIFHAAAYKHVPLLESQAGQAVQNNILGTYNVAACADAFKVDKFILISTDKAVNSTNIMGTTKRAAEMICQAYNQQSNTSFMAVRFGNVLGSRGSVIPLFKKQIKAGGPITVTHPEIERFFMTIPEAVGLVLEASSIGKGGELFVLDMGEPVKITYLAEQLIKLSGKEVGTDIEIKYTGLRPGEKLFEELSYQDENMELTSCDKVFVVTGSSPVNLKDVKASIKMLTQDIHKLSHDEMAAKLANMVPESKILKHSKHIEKEEVLV